MTRFDFYHLQKTPLEQVLPKLMEKAYATKKRIKILVGVEERVEFINSLLWTYNEESFLPHASKKDGFTEEQPILISSDIENENNASIIVIIDGAYPEISILEQYERVLNIFDGNDETALNKARNYWKEIKSYGKELHYWQQNDSGSFEQKA
ncbi:MAG: DNA polymerase III subunit chi [Alphaproteobacteria bacterium]|nr:DNA polymerase III subunit chi [Alphaproteobacteria bacterium]